MMVRSSSKQKCLNLLKTGYELVFNTTLSKTQSVVELDYGTLQVVDSKNLTNWRVKSPES